MRTFAAFPARNHRMQTRQNERSDSGQTDRLEDHRGVMHLYAAVSSSISSAEPEFVLWIACSRRSKPLLQQPRLDSITHSSPKHEKFLQLEKAARFACWRICLRKPAFCEPHYHSCQQHTMDFQPRSAGRRAYTGSNPKLCFFVFTKLSCKICCVALENC
jgi:hypothetical protein